MFRFLWSYQTFKSNQCIFFFLITHLYQYSLWRKPSQWQFSFANWKEEFRIWYSLWEVIALVVEKQFFLIGSLSFQHRLVIFSTYHRFKRNRFQLRGDYMQIICVFVAKLLNRCKVLSSLSLTSEYKYLVKFVTWSFCLGQNSFGIALVNLVSK